MKTSICILFAVTCLVVATAEDSPTVLTLNKVMFELKKIKEWSKGQDNNTPIHSPTVNDIEDCCIASALECFQSKWIEFPVNDKLKKSQITIKRNLGKTFIVKSVSSCSPEETKKAKCKTCDSYPLVHRHKFLENFHTLLQKIFVRLQ
nr:interleukin-21 isoform X1 [Misgurnus anguillicaudatus]